jgi:hypothetical protein
MTKETLDLLRRSRQLHAFSRTSLCVGKVFLTELCMSGDGDAVGGGAH